MLNTIEELKNQQIWVAVKTKKEKGKITKEHMDAKGYRIGNTDKYKNKWMTYNNAVKAKEELLADAVGFIIPSGYAVIDIDNKDKDDPMSCDILKKFDTYAEKSVSGKGIHVIFKADTSKLPTQTNEKGVIKLDEKYYVKNSKSDIEIYIGDLNRHFMTYTGGSINDKEISDCTQGTIDFLNAYMLRNGTTPKTEKDAPANTTAANSNSLIIKERQLADPEKIIEKLDNAKNGEKFHTLFYEGNFEKLGYKSQSEADAALCTMIAFYTGDNEELIDQIFRKSALYREKWEREDYRKATIKSGITLCNGTFYNSIPPFIKGDSKGKPKVFEGLLADYFRNNNHHLIVRENNSSEKPMLYLYNCSKGVYEQASWNDCKRIMAEYVRKYNPRLVTSATLDSAAKLIQIEKSIDHDSLDSDENIINFENGILKMGDNDLTFTDKHDPKILSTIQIPCRWQIEPTPTPVFDSFMNDFTSGNKEVQELLLQFIGACISNVKGYRMKKALFLVGEGNTGKSQLIRLVERILGESNCKALGLSDLEGNRFALSTIEGKRLVCGADLSAMTVKELSKFKSLTGGDTLFAERKGRDGFDLRFNGLLWFAMNRFAKFGGDDGDWVYDRIMVIECNNVVPYEKQNANLADDMYRERDGIVHKSILAFQQVLGNGCKFSEPTCVKEAREKYKCENNPVLSFFNECMVKRPICGKFDDSCTMGKLINVFRAWCAKNNSGYTKSGKEFRDIIKRHLKAGSYDEITSHRREGTFLNEYTLSDEAKKEYQSVYGYDPIGLNIAN